MEMTRVLVLPVGCVTKSREKLRIDAECFRTELSDTSTNDRTVEHIRS